MKPQGIRAAVVEYTDNVFIENILIPS